MSRMRDGHAANDGWPEVHAHALNSTHRQAFAACTDVIGTHGASPLRIG